MFTAYSDASIKNNKSYLAFVIFFEDKSKINRRIVINDVADSNAAEALAISEILSFLSYYNLKKGLILLDSNGVKSQLKKKGRKIHKYLPNDIKETLRNLQIRTQVIPRKYNKKAHKICYKDRFLKSRDISKINRNVYQKLNGYPDYYLQLSAFEEYRRLFNEPNITFHNALQKVNKKIWSVGNVEMARVNSKLYSIDDTWIKVYENTIVKIAKESFFDNIIVGCENNEKPDISKSMLNRAKRKAEHKG